MGDYDNLLNHYALTFMFNDTDKGFYWSVNIEFVWYRSHTKRGIDVIQRKGSNKHITTRLLKKKKKNTPRRLFEKQVCMLPPVHDTFYSCARDKFHKEAMCMIRSIIFSLTQLYLLDSAIIRKNICQCGLTLFQMHKLIMYRTKFL